MQKKLTNLLNEKDGQNQGMMLGQLCLSEKGLDI